MDSVDLQIIELLKRNSRITSSEISKAIHLSVPSVSERIRKLEEKGMIEQFTIRLNREITGRHLLAYISVILEHPKYIESFKEQISNESCIIECHHLAGDYDYLLKVGVPDISSLEVFISETLKGLAGVQKTKTTIVLSTLKEA
ncbi:Lrp/AsnC family transcriptional regulator [Paenibacillus sp. FSL R5-0407]|uniref:Lrp/AsnC family transcriptional regulator n=1 Tax=Paenibacillus sp. FSL R5-0407 TaxID=2975320 RepID=UPI0030FAAD7C